MAKTTSIAESFTTGLTNAISKNGVRDICSCGFPMPVYTGRYPSKCPQCGAGRGTPLPEEPETPNAEEDED